MDHDQLDLSRLTSLRRAGTLLDHGLPWNSVPLPGTSSRGVVTVSVRPRTLAGRGHVGERGGTVDLHGDVEQPPPAPSGQVREAVVEAGARATTKDHRDAPRPGRHLERRRGRARWIVRPPAPGYPVSARPTATAPLSPPSPERIGVDARVDGHPHREVDRGGHRRSIANPAIQSAPEDPAGRDR